MPAPAAALTATAREWLEAGGCARSDLHSAHSMPALLLHKGSGHGAAVFACQGKRCGVLCCAVMCCWPGDVGREAHLWKLFAVRMVFPFSWTVANVSSPSKRSCTAELANTAAVLGSLVENVVLKVHVSLATHLLCTSLYLQTQTQTPTHADCRRPFCCGRGAVGSCSLLCRLLL